MKHKLTSIVAAGVVALAVTAAAANATVHTGWYHHATGITCTDNATGANAGPFVSRSACLDWAPAAQYCLNGTTPYQSNSASEQRFLNYAAAYGLTVETSGGNVYPDFDEDAGDTTDDSTIAAGPCASAATGSGPDGVPVCPSKSGSNTNPEFYPFDTAQSLIQAGSAVMASAVGYAVAGNTNTITGVDGVTYTIVCNPKGAATGKYLQLDGSVVSSSTKAEDDTEFKAGIDAPNQDNTKDIALFA